MAYDVKLIQNEKQRDFKYEICPKKYSPKHYLTGHVKNSQIEETRLSIFSCDLTKISFVFEKSAITYSLFWAVQ